MLEVLVAFGVAAGAFLSGGYAFGGVRRRRAILELFEIRKEVSRAADRTKVDDLIESELEALVKLGNTTTRWVKSGYMFGLLLFMLSCFAVLVFLFVVGEEARNAVRYVAASLCLASAWVVAITNLIRLEGAVNNRWSRASPLIFLSTVIAGAVVSLCLVVGTPYFNGLFGLHG